MKQYNQMCLAQADVTASGGAKADDQLMISFMENALPPAYATIRQMLRYSDHKTFDAYYNDLLTQVKAEERASQLQASAGVFSASTSRVDAQQLKPKGGKPAGGKGERGGKADAKNPCFNCGQLDHPRFRCPCPPVKCQSSVERITWTSCVRGAQVAP